MFSGKSNAFIFLPASLPSATLLQCWAYDRCPRMFEKVLENSWEEHISQSLNCLFICLFTSLSASVGTMWGLLVGYIANPVWPFKSHMISALPTWLVSSQMIFLSILKDSFNVSIFCLLWALAYVVFSGIFFPPYTYVNQHVRVESYRNLYSTSFGKREIYEKHTSISHNYIRAGMIETLGTTGTGN